MDQQLRLEQERTRQQLQQQYKTRTDVQSATGS
jgi:hypothetical protein